LPDRTADELSDVIARFRRAEAALSSLVDGSARLASVQDAMESAKSDSLVIQKEVQALAANLAKEAAALSQVATTLHRLDPDEMRRHLSQMAEAAERLRSRLDEVAGDQNARLGTLRDDLRAFKEEVDPAALHARLVKLENGFGQIRSESKERWSLLQGRLDGLQRRTTWALGVGVIILLVVIGIAVIVLRN